jgi:hypothetical protein
MILMIDTAAPGYAARGTGGAVPHLAGRGTR